MSATKTAATVSLAQIAKEVKITPKSARRILRNSETTPAPVTDARWVWTKENAAKVRAILKR